MLRFDRLATPSDDGAILLEPAGGDWPGLLEANLAARPGDAIALAGVPLTAARDEVRRRLLGTSADQPVIAAGHQPQFVHPGVWAKHVVVRHFSRTHGVTSLDLVVDNDAPPSGDLAVPVRGDDGYLTTQELAFTESPAGSAYEGRPPLGRDRHHDLKATLGALLGERFAGSPMADYLAGAGSAGDARDAVDEHLAGRGAVDRALEADLREVRVSRAFGGPFAADLLLDAERFRGAYNDALSAYRREQHVREPDRPLPDLRREGDRIESPLWVYQPARLRRRLWVEPGAERLALFADASPVGDLSREDVRRDPDAALARLAPWVVRPRALTLTLWARLLVCDLFVHGIGGAKYDRITDRIMRGYYNVEAPAYVCVSATLRLPLPRYEATWNDLLDARRRVRDWRYNPDRYLAGAPAEDLDERRRLIDKSGCLRAEQGPRMERRDVFRAIRRINEKLCASDPAAGRELAARRDRLERELASNRVADGREYFYALQPRDRLVELRSRLVAAMS